MPGAQQSRRDVAFCAILVLACGLAYSNSFRGVFHMDDALRILDDPSVRTLTGSVTGTSRPLTGLSIWMNHALGGSLAGFHLFNLLVHVAASVVLFAVLRLVFGRWLASWLATRPTDATVAWLAFVAALLWTVHPLNTQSVTYIVQRAESMAGLYFLLSAWCALRRLDGGTQDRASPAEMPGRRVAWLEAGAGICAMLAVAAKPVLVTGPLLILLYDALAVSGSVRAAVRRHARLYAALSTAWILAGLLLAGPHESRTTVGIGQGLIAPWRYALTQAEVVLHYLRLALLPVGQSFDYAWLPAIVSVRSVGVAVLVVGLLGLAVIAYRRGWWGGFAVLFMAVALAPTSSVIPIADSAVEHRMYVPLMAFCALLTGLGYRLCRRLEARWPGGRAMRLGVLCVLAVAVMLTGATYARNALYGSRLMLAQDTLQRRPDNFRAWSVYMDALLMAGRVDDAFEASRMALARARQRAAQGGVYAMTGAMNAAGHMPVLLNHQGRVLLAQQRPDAALQRFREALAWRPEFHIGHINAALALMELGHYDEALRETDMALTIKPDAGRAYTIRAVILDRQGLPEAARAARERAVTLGDGESVETAPPSP